MGDLQAGAGPPSGGNADILIPNANAKRQRRPSVRLNEIGDQSADSYLRKTKQWKTPDEKHWKPLHEDLLKTHITSQLQLQPQHHLTTTPLKTTSDLILATKLSKTRPLGNIGNNDSQNQGPMQVIHEDNNTINQNMVMGDEDLQLVEYGNGRNNNMQVNKGRNASKKVRQAKGRRGGNRTKLGASKVLRVSPEEENDNNDKGSGEDGFGEPMSNASYDADTPEGFRDFDLDTSDNSPGDMKGTSGLHADSLANVGLFNQFGAVGDEFREHGKSEETWIAAHNSKEHHALTLDYMDGNLLEIPSDTETRSKMEEAQREAAEKERIPKHRIPPLFQDGGVRAWLNGLGLGRYGQLFEMHEVDTEVLPLLTLDDLKDMGINAVGSRRKMYNAIQKLQNNFTV